MALIEVDGDAFAKLQAELEASKPSKALLDKLGSNPKTRQRILGLIKEANPDLAIPEIDAAKPYLDRIEALEKQIADDRSERQKEKDESAKSAAQKTVEQKISEGRSALKKAGWQDDGIGKVEELMQKRGLTDYEAAAALFERTQPKDVPIIPSDFGGRSMPMIDESNEDQKLLIKNKNSWKQWQNKQIRNWFTEKANGTLVL